MTPDQIREFCDEVIEADANVRMRGAQLAKALKWALALRRLVRCDMECSRGVPTNPSGHFSGCSVNMVAGIMDAIARELQG